MGGLLSPWVSRPTSDDVVKLYLSSFANVVSEFDPKQMNHVHVFLPLNRAALTIAAL